VTGLELRKADAADRLPATFAATVGFVGHIDLNRVGIGPEALARDLAQVARSWSINSGGALRLATGVAPGSDALAIRTWHSERLGPILGLYPDVESCEAARDRGEHVLLSHYAFVSHDDDERHHALASRILEVSDRLLAIYDGKGFRGRGGTADTIRRAREAKMPVCTLP
jgi:hypothetical protein